MHSLYISVDSLLSAREYTAPIHSPGSHPNTSLLRARWTPARMTPLAHRTPHSWHTASATSCAWCDFDTQRLHAARRAPKKNCSTLLSPYHTTGHTCTLFSQQHPTFTHVGDACLVYQRLLVNSYCTSDLCRLHGLARPPSASCDWHTFGHSTMSDPADAWFPRPRTPPALNRHSSP